VPAEPVAGRSGQGERRLQPDQRRRGRYPREDPPDLQGGGNSAASIRRASTASTERPRNSVGILGKSASASLRPKSPTWLLQPPVSGRAARACSSNRRRTRIIQAKSQQQRSSLVLYPGPPSIPSKVTWREAVDRPQPPPRRTLGLIGLSQFVHFSTRENHGCIDCR
jgi:hypothetical protein